MGRSFHLNENSETLDSYVTHIRQVALLLAYSEPHVLEVFKNTLPSRLYWALFSIEDLRQTVETVKRILTKEKIDRQLAGQSSSTPFMNIWVGYNSGKKVVPLDTQETLDDKLDKITFMMRGQYSGNSRRNDRSSSRLRLGSRASTNRDRIRCFKCREYDHFSKDCQNISDTENEQSEQIQQMLNAGRVQNSFKGSGSRHL